MIIIAVLGVLALLLVMVLNLASEAGLATQMMTRIQEQDRAALVGRSAVTAATRLLPKEGPHTLLDPWAFELPLPVDGKMVTIRIVDEERWFNPNYCAEGISPDAAGRIKALRRLFLLMDQDPTVANAIVDWVDTDSTRTEPGGAEGFDYPARPCKSAPMDSVDELMYVKGMTSLMMNGEDRPEHKVPGLRNLLTAWSNGKINVNTAPVGVLQCISQGLDENVARAIVDYRSTKPFRRLEDMLDVPGFTPDRLYDFKKVAGVDSATWRIEATVASGTGPDAQRVKVITVYRADPRGFRPIFWNVEEVGEEPSSPTDGASPSAMPTAWPSGLPSGLPSPSLTGLPGRTPGGLPGSGGDPMKQSAPPGLPPR